MEKEFHLLNYRNKHHNSSMLIPRLSWKKTIFII